MVDLVWLVLCLSGLSHVPVWGQEEGCGTWTEAEIRNVISRAIQGSREALAMKKQLNEHLSRIGFDEAMNPTPYQPKTYHQHYAAFSHLNHDASVQVDSGFMVNWATAEMVKAFRTSIDDLPRCSMVMRIWHELIAPICSRREAQCNPTYKYRTISGGCNNLNNPLWGKSDRPHRRWLQAQYMDDVSMPRQTGASGEFLPSPRLISNVVHRQDPCCPMMERDLSLYVMQWGQMLDHDITDTAILKGANDATIICCNLTQELLMQRTECFPIPIPPNDERFGEPCMNFVRSVAGHDDNCNFGRRNQLNQATSFVDASFLYGHNDEDAPKIRSFQNGELRMTEQDLFPPGVEDQTHCELQNPGDYCMKSGDFRIQVMPGLTALQVLFLREHNRIAKILARKNPQWCDEDIYQETRRIIIAQIQHITYTHWLPHVIGDEYALRFGLMTSPTGHDNVYDQSVDPSITNIFGVSAFRFGHTLLQNTVLFMKDQGMYIRNEMAFNRPTMIFSDNAMGCSFVGLGLAMHPSSKADGQIVGSVRDNLFLDRNGRSFDLISLNIQRGRDHGVPGYNDWRRFCGLPFAIHFFTGPGGLVDHSPENARKLMAVYRHPDDIDIFPGGMSEEPVRGGVLGPLFTCIVAHQFRNLKYGDRFYYENNLENTAFTTAQLNSIKNITLSRLMCNHFHLSQVQMNPFRMTHEMNPQMSCESYPDIDFSLWQH